MEHDEALDWASDGHGNSRGLKKFSGVVVVGDGGMGREWVGDR